MQKSCQELRGKVFRFVRGGGGLRFDVRASYFGVSHKAHFLCLPQVVCLGWDFLRVQEFSGALSTGLFGPCKSCHLFVGVAFPGGCLELSLWLFGQHKYHCMFWSCGVPLLLNGWLVGCYIDRLVQATSCCCVA